MRALTVAAAAAAFYGLFTFGALAIHDWNPLWFVWIGERFASGDPNGRTGYDGQFVYYLARDGWAALPHLDNPPYRMQRILYPAVVRVLSAGNADAVAWLMLAINLLALPAATFLLAGWLERRAVSPWYALVYPGWIGSFMAFSRDLTEPFAFGLAAAGVLAWLDESSTAIGRRRAVAVGLFALAGLARETTLLLPLGLALAALARRQWSAAAILAATPIPLLAWQAYLSAVLGLWPSRAAPTLMPIPLAGALANLDAEPGRLTALAVVALPAVLLLAVALQWLRRDHGAAVGWLLAVQALFVLALPEQVYTHAMAAARNATGGLLALLLAFPELAPRWRHVASVWAVAPTLVWLLPVLRWAPWTARL